MGKEVLKILENDARSTTKQISAMTGKTTQEVSRIIKKAEKGEIPPGSCLIVSTGYGKNWESPDYLKKCPFPNKEAMYYLIDKKPFIIVFDTPAAENDVNPENAFDRYFEENILTVTACVNLEKITKWNVKLIVMPLKLRKVALGSPARAIVIEE